MAAAVALVIWEIEGRGGKKGILNLIVAQTSSNRKNAVAKQRKRR